MATPLHGKDFTFTIGGTTVDNGFSDISISMDWDTVETTAAADDTGKTFLGGDYTCTWSASGPIDWTDTTGTSEVIQAIFDGGADSWVFKPDDAAVGAANPTYTQNVILTNLTISTGITDCARMSISGQGTGAITRAEA